jgi:hypothetical protein
VVMNMSVISLFSQVVSSRTPLAGGSQVGYVIDPVLNVESYMCVVRTVTTAWRVLRLRMEERPPIWRIAANILNKQSRTADKGWSSSLGLGRR